MSDLDHASIEQYVLSMPNAVREYPFGEDVAVYKVQNKMFALITEGKEPVQISLKCDPLLAQKLRDDFESVQPGYHLNKKHWNTIVLTGQLERAQVEDLIRHSYQLVSGL